MQKTFNDIVRIKIEDGLVFKNPIASPLKQHANTGSMFNGHFSKFFSRFLSMLGLRAETRLASLVEYDGLTKHKIEGHLMNVLCVPAAFPPRPYGTNMYIIWCKDTHDAVIVDPGMETFQVVLEAVRQYSLNPIAIWLTHSHCDHIIDAGKVKSAFSVPVFVHEEDKGNLKNPGSDGVPMPVPTIEGITPDHLLKDGDLLTVGEISFKTIHTPGHTPGGVCFYCREEKKLFSGDTFYRGLIGNLTLTTGQAERIWPSLDRISTLPPDTVVFPGHGPSTAIKDEPWLSDAKKKGVVHQYN